MQLVYLVLILAGFYPLARAWLTNRRTSLRHAVAWAIAAWIFWGVALVFGSPHTLGLDPWRYFALCLTGAAGVAVLGARRPQVGAWNVVVLGLMAVMLLPLGEQMFVGTPALAGLRAVFVGAILAVGILNYVPTAAAVPALLLGCICAAECLLLVATDLAPEPAALDILHASLLVIPWLALAFWRSPRLDNLAINRLWHDFRDRFGLFWGQRLRDQYNRSAAQAGLPGFLHWHGWQLEEKDGPPTEDQAQEMLAIFQALLKRFRDDVGPGAHVN